MIFSEIIKEYPQISVAVNMIKKEIEL